MEIFSTIAIPHEYVMPQYFSGEVRYINCQRKITAEFYHHLKHSWYRLTEPSRFWGCMTLRLHNWQHYRLIWNWRWARSEREKERDWAIILCSLNWEWARSGHLHCLQYNQDIRGEETVSDLALRTISGTPHRPCPCFSFPSVLLEQQT